MARNGGSAVVGDPPGQAVTCLGVGTDMGESDMALVVMGLSVGRQRPAAERGVKEMGFCWGGKGKQQRPVPYRRASDLPCPFSRCQLPWLP